MKIKYADGVSFAVPMDSVSAIIEQFRKHGLVYLFPYIGLFLLIGLLDIYLCAMRTWDTYANLLTGTLNIHWQVSPCSETSYFFI